MKRSKTVQDKIDELYALMATAAARKAIVRIEACDDICGADRWADAAARWMDKSSAKQVSWNYNRPRPVH